MQIKHLKSALISLNQKKILPSQFLNKQKTNLADSVLSQISKSVSKLKKISSNLSYKSNKNKKIHPSGIEALAGYLKEQKGLKGLSISKYDLKQKLQKEAYVASQIDNQQKLAERRDKQSQKLARQNELYNRLDIAQNTKPLNSQPINQNAESPVKPSLISSFWQTAKKQVLSDNKSPSIGFVAAKPMATIADAGIKTPPKIPLAV